MAASFENSGEKGKLSSEGSIPGLPRMAAPHELDERRRAALAEIDNAKFSYVDYF